MSNKEIAKCICCWCDLLGFKNDLIAAKWDLSDKKCEQTLERIRIAGKYYSDSWALKPVGTKLVSNDGYAYTMDLEENDSESYEDLLYFLDGTINDYITVNHIETIKDTGGIRGFITLGTRYVYNSSDITLLENNPRYIHLKEFQLNTAFSKAYLLDEAGSDIGLSDGYLYLDREILDYLIVLSDKYNQKRPEIKTETKHFDDRQIEISVYLNDNLFAKCCVLPEKVHVNFKGIESDFYRLKSFVNMVDIA